MSYIEQQTEKLATIYKETLALRWIANINAIFNGLLLFYMLLTGFGGAPLVVVFCVFIINASFFFSSYLKERRSTKKEV